MKGFKPSCRVKVNADGDWQILPPPGQIVKIGDAAGALVPPADNDDLLVTGKLAAIGQVACGGGFQIEGDTRIIGRVAYNSIGIVNNEQMTIRMRQEEITIPVGAGAAGHPSVSEMFQGHTIILMVYARITQAPGGGPAVYSLYRTGIAGDLLLENQFVTMGSKAEMTGGSDGTHDGPFFNYQAKTCVIKTNANVTGSDMKIRVGITYMQFWNFDD